MNSGEGEHTTFGATTHQPPSDRRGRPVPRLGVGLRRLTGVSMYIKICGLSDVATALHAVTSGADAIGVVMSEGSPRNTTPAMAESIVRAVGTEAPQVDRVLVVRHTPAVEAAECAYALGFDVLQLHGGHSPEDFAAALRIMPRVWRATSLASDPELTAGAYGEEHLLVDGTNPGSGETWDVTEATRADLGTNWILAGGLTPENVHEAIALSQPWGVDVSSGVESSPGVKDLGRITHFIRTAGGPL